MNDFTNILAWISNAAFSIAAIPQVVKTIKDGHADGLSNYMILLWFLGEAGSAVVVWDKNMPAFLISYILNTLFLLVIIAYKIKPSIDNIRKI